MNIILNKVKFSLKEKFRKIWVDDLQDDKRKNHLHQNKWLTYNNDKIQS
jgi:hypothetical protein